MNRKCKKQLKLNKMRCFFFEDNLKNVLKNNVLIVKESNNFTIYKELSTDVYILSIPNLLIIEYKYRRNLEDFLLLYKESDDLLFDIYTKNNYYYIICVSKYKNDPFDYKLWLLSNDAHSKYILFTKIFNSFFIMNNHWTKTDKKFVYYQSVGNGKLNLEIRNTLKMYINLMNDLYLPNHYLAF